MAAKISNERMNQKLRSIERIIRAAQKHSALGRNRSVKPTKNKKMARISNLFQKVLK